MNLHARDIEPDLGPLLELAEALPDEDALGNSKTEPSLKADERKKAGLALGPMDRIGSEGSFSTSRTPRRSLPAAQAVSPILSAWGGFWRAVVVGVVAGVVGGIVGAFTLVWLTGAGWTVFAKLLIDAI